MQKLNGLEQTEIDNRRKASEAIVGVVAEEYDARRLQLFTQANGSRSAAGLSWERQELVVRTGSRSSEHEEFRGGDDATKRAAMIEARLNTSLAVSFAM